MKTTQTPTLPHPHIATLLTLPHPHIPHPHSKDEGGRMMPPGMCVSVLHKSSTCYYDNANTVAVVVWRSRGGDLVGQEWEVTGQRRKR